MGSDGNTTVVVECVGGNDHIENYHLDEVRHLLFLIQLYIISAV